MARITHGKKFLTRRGRYGSYKYVNGRRVSFVSYHKPAKITRSRRKRNSFKRRY